MEHPTQPGLTPALEDYLETIYRLISEEGMARVGDIARERGVRPGSVTPAMKRLDQMGLIIYQQRDHVGLTPTGEAVARKVYARHQVLTRFFTNILNLPLDIAEADACAAEHSLSSQALDQLVRLFEYMEICPEGREQMGRFLACSAVHPDISDCAHDCPPPSLKTLDLRTSMSVADLKPGQLGRVQHVDCEGAARRRLLDMGVLPDTQLTVSRVAPAGDPIWIQLDGYELALRVTEARSVIVELQI